MVLLLMSRLGYRAVVTVKVLVAPIPVPIVESKLVGTVRADAPS